MIGNIGSAKDISPVINFIFELLFDTSKDKIFEKINYKQKIKKILYKDIQNIKWFFRDINDYELYNLIEDFLIYSIYTDVSFYSPSNLTEEQENDAWKFFKKRIKTSNIDIYIKNDYKPKIIECINLHNTAINDIMLDSNSLRQMRFMQKEFDSMEKHFNNLFNTLNTNNLFSTLNTNTSAQQNDEELDFLVVQLNSIINSYANDVLMLRKQQIILCCIAVAVFIISISIYFFNYRDIATGILIILFTILLVLLAVILFFFIKTSKKLSLMEDKLEVMRRKIFYIHEIAYENTLRQKFIYYDN